MLRSLSLIKGAWRTATLFKPVNARLLHTVRAVPPRALAAFPANHVHTQSSNKQGRPDLQSIDRSLLRLDTEIRKTGRISRREIEEILDDIREMKTATTTQSLMILRCCGDLVPEEKPENRTKLVQEVWKTLENLNVPVDISHYNALLRVYLENEHKFDPTEFLQELSNKGIEPNRVTYQRLIARYCQEGNIDGASTILQHMKEKQLPINEHVFNALVLGHAKANDMESAEGMLAVMRQAGLEPNDDTYTTLMSGYAQKGDITNIQRIVKECESKEIFLIDRDFLTVIYTLAANGHESLIDEVIPYLKKHTGFNQEATNTILRLVNIGQEEVAYKILKLMPRPVRQDELAPSGGFFIRQMVVASTPSETIVRFCKKMEEDGLNKFALSKACESALHNRVFDKAFDLLEALKESGFPIRQHYFWPFFAGKRTEKEVYNGLKCMIYLDSPPNTETLREYVVPALLDANFRKQAFEAVLDKLSAYTSIPISVIAPCALQHLLSIGDIENASKFALRYKIKLTNPWLRRAVVETYLKTKDAKSTARIVGCTGNTDEEAREAAGAILLDVLEIARTQDKLKTLAPLLKEFEANGIGLSNSSAELIQNQLGDKMTADITNTILKLTSGDMVRKVENFGDVRKRETLDSKSVEELEDICMRSKAQGRPNTKIQKMLLIQYCKDGNLEKAEEFINDLRGQGFVFPPAIHYALLDMYAEKNMVDKAREVYKTMQASQLDFIMDDTKILKYGLALATSGAHEEFMDLIKNQKRNEARSPQGVTQNALVWKILNVYAEQGRVSDLKEVFDTLTQRNLSPINNVVLGPLVKAHLVKDDLEGALAEFEHCVKEYKFSPWKGELFVRFIKAEDAERLQKVLDLSTSLHGEVNCLYDLVFAFLDCGKIRQAKKILDTPGLRARNERLETVCQRYLDNDRTEDLERLIEVTRDVFNVDRSTLYFYLLKAHCKANNPDKALSVWTALQEENLNASQEFLAYLADFLRKNNREVPFVVPAAQKTHESTSGSVADKKPEGLRNLRRALEDKRLDDAIGIRQKLMSEEGAKPTIQDESQLIAQLALAERLSEAVRVTEDMVNAGGYPFRSTMRLLMKKLSNARDVDTMRRLYSQLPKAAWSGSRPQSLILTTMVYAGRGNEFLSELKQRLQDAVSQSPTAAVSREFVEESDVALARLVKEQPESIKEVEALAEQYSKEDIGDVLNQALWSHNVINKNYKEARNILETKMKDSNRIMFASILQKMRENSDIELGKEMWNQIRGTSLGSRAKGKALSVLLDIQRDQNVGDAMATLQDALGTITLEDIPYNVLVSLKKATETSGQKFPYEIPERQRRRRNLRRKDAESSGSDSDSD